VQGKLMKIKPMLLAGALALTKGNLWAASGLQDSIEQAGVISELEAWFGPNDCRCPAADGADLTAINTGANPPNRCSRFMVRTRPV
jgi:hypothetical protein